MRFHVISLPHTQTTKEYLPCAYTQKVVNFCRMMMSLGHEVFLYASEDNDAPCTELITCITKEEQRATLKGVDDWKTKFFPIEWKGTESYWRIMNGRAISEIATRIQEKDFICVIGGSCQKMIADAFPGHMCVEFGIGYKGTFSAYRVFESYAWMHWVYGHQNNENGKSYDTVIPNYLDAADFPFCEEPDDYLLFIGRMIGRKGIAAAADLANRIGKKLILAGQGVIESSPGKIVAHEITIEGDVEHVGTVGVADRGRLMSRAAAVLVPTQYVGPFEGVHVEALMCGTPVITTDWGVFSETVVDGVNGFRTRTLGEMIWAAGELKKLDRAQIRKDAIARFSLDSVKWRYHDYFKQLLTLWDEGWYTEAFDPEPKRILGNFR